ncbi:hypothetical protein MMC28_004818 [Mycoblastus sanguinarius]|nr:hypothetical protein [Mycoblastus sanguinarius]
MSIERGQISQGETVREITVLIEKQSHKITNRAGLEETAACLACEATSSSTTRGILKCLGYREGFLSRGSLLGSDLVFEIPDGLTKMQTLQTLIYADRHRGHGGEKPLDYRFQLSHRIAEALLSVHALQRVHKNIRTDNILLLKSINNEESQIGDPYLIDWTMLRSTRIPSNQKGDNDWLTNIYRHPRRQGWQLEDRYNMGHDIYSLGVCLLEIGLWEPLIVENDGHHMLHWRFCKAAVDTDAVDAKDVQNVVALTRPRVVQQVFIALAKKELQSRMGIAYTDLVISCLTCLEGGFGDAKEFEENQIAVGVKFKDLVLQPLSALS